MDTLTYVLAAPETRVIAALLGWVVGLLSACLLSLVVNR